MERIFIMITKNLFISERIAFFKEEIEMFS